MILLLGAGFLAAVGVGLVVYTRVNTDVVGVTTVFLALTFGMSARWVVGPLGAIGQPALLVAGACAWWWATARMSRDPGLHRGPDAVRGLLLFVAWFLLLTFVLSFTRPLTTAEANESARSVLLFTALFGVALLIGDGVADRTRLDVLVDRLISAAMFLAVIGIVQFVFGRDPWTAIDIPGLVLNRDSASVGERAMFNRPFATALHPIEFGVVTAGMLPLALHRALHPAAGRGPVGRWIPVLLLGTAVPMSVSRSAVVAIVVGLLVLAGRWSWQRRAVMSVRAFVFVVWLWALVPGLIGTVLSLFENAGNDPSIQARTDRIPRVLELWSQQPWIGRGFGTYNNTDHFLLDNELFALLIDTGVVGVAIWVGAMVAICGLVLAGTARSDPGTRHLAGALVACIAALLSSMATFDAFAYRILLGALFVLIGCGMALRRLERETAAPGTPPRPPLSEPRRGLTAR